MKKILVPTDFSPLAETALNVAAEISRKTKAEIELLHVIETPYEGSFSATGDIIETNGMNDVYVLKSIQMAKRKIRAIMDDVKYVGIRFNPKIKSGNAYRHFTDIIVKENIDLIVMGTEGATGYMKGIFNASNTEEVVMHAKCMVLSIKKNTKDFKIKNVILATNFEDHSTEFIENLKELQELFDFKLHVLYINSLMNGKVDLNEIANKKNEFIKIYKIKNYEFHAFENLTEYNGITEYAEKINADIIALTTHQKKGFWHWVGGVSEDLVNYADKPVLTYKTE